MARVLVLCEHASLNGGERSFLAVAGRLCALGYDLCVAAPPDGPLANALQAASLRLVPLQLTLPGTDVGTQADRRNRLRSLLLAQAPDLLHANNLAASRLAGPIVAELGVPSVAHLRDIIRLSAAALRDLNQHVRLLAVSDAVRSFYLAAGLDPDKVHVLHNGVDLQRFRPRDPTGYLARELRIPPTAPLVVTIGQIGMRKGLDVLVQAAARVILSRPESQFLIIGSRYSNKREAIDHERMLRREAAVGPLTGHVQFLGTREDVEFVLPEAMLLVHAARQEPLGRVLLEAAAAGTPVVATDVGGTREVFSPETEAALLVPSANPALLAQAILRVMADADLRQRMALAGRRIAETRFDAGQSAARLAEHYHQALARKR